MDLCASTLLAFPRDNVSLVDNEGYDGAVRVHINSLTKLLKEQIPLLQSSAAQLLEVGGPGASLPPREHD